MISVIAFMFLLILAFFSNGSNGCFQFLVYPECLEKEEIDEIFSVFHVFGIFDN